MAGPASTRCRTRYDARELEGLPAPVQRYFRAVLKDGQPIITAVTIDMAGRFNMSPTGEQWKPFTSRQRVITQRPGFLWDASIAMLPGLNVRVVDSYITGQGLLRAAVQGLFTMAEQQGDGDIARGEFMRWFAEVLWYPTALLPSQGVRWEAVDDGSANATLADGPLGLTLLFRFNDAGLIGSFRAEARGGMVGDKLVMAPWEGRWSDYRKVDGVLVPFIGEVAWMRPEGTQALLRRHGHDTGFRVLVVNWCLAGTVVVPAPSGLASNTRSAAGSSIAAPSARRVATTLPPSSASALRSTWSSAAVSTGRMVMPAASNFERVWPIHRSASAVRPSAISSSAHCGPSEGRPCSRNTRAARGTRARNSAYCPSSRSEVSSPSQA
jgi:hypothetical protein